ncbi:MAG TPA: ATP-binding protein [Candidatus Eisenbacteria bacterium]
MLRILPQLIDSLTDAVIVTDREHRVVAANRRYLEVFGGAGRAGVAGVDCHVAVRCAEAVAGFTPDTCAACDVVQSGSPQRRLRVVSDESGAARRWEATFSPVLDGGGRVSHVVEVWRDVSERSHLESQLSHSERLASLGILAAGVAHEINNPLASILAGVDCLARWLGTDGRFTVSPDEAREVLSVLGRETSRCRDITDKLLLLAQPYSVEPTWVSLNRAVEDTVSLLRYQMQKQQVRSVAELTPELPDMWGKESGVRAICMNLMLNAVQAMPKGGTLTVRTRRAGAGVGLEVEDTGPGIAAPHMDRIWDPFFTTKPPGEGTGLGLSIAQRIVTRHGGRIRAENRTDGGARFIVELPVEGPGGIDA